MKISLRKIISVEVELERLRKENEILKTCGCYIEAPLSEKLAGIELENRGHKVSLKRLRRQMKELDIKCKQSLGIGTCRCGFALHAFKWNRKLLRLLNLPSGYKIGSVLLFGPPAVDYIRATDPEPFPIHTVTTQE